ASRVARRPDENPRHLALVGDPSDNTLAPVSKFFGAYLADNGAYGTGGNGTTGPGHPGGLWEPNRWNSARMDTTEQKFLPASGFLDIGSTANLTHGQSCTQSHESDPKFSILGIAKNRCFFQSLSTGHKVSNLNVNCGNLNGNPGYPPAGLYQNAGVAIA